MKKKEQGILTIEASIVLTLCVMFMLFLFSFARVYNAQSLVSHALIQSSDAVALESYLRERTLTGSETDVIELANRFMGTTSIKAGSYTSLRSADVSQIAKEKFVYAVGKSESEADAKLKNLGVKDGLSGIDFSASHIDLGNDDVVVYVTYNIEMQFPVFGKDEITVTKAAKSKTFGDILFAIETIPQDPIMGEAFGGGNYKFGTQIEISAVPKYGYKFTKWSDGNVDNPRTVTVAGAKTYVAVFEQSEFGVNLVSSPSTGGSTTGDGVFKYLDSATISATPATGYHFSEWSIYGHSDKKTKKVYEQTTSLQVDQSYTCTAKFDKNLYTVKVETSGITSGNAYILYNGNVESSITVPYQVEFELIAPEFNGCLFKGWMIKDTDTIFSPSTRVLDAVPASDITYIAYYESILKTVEFYGYDGSLYATRQVNEGDSLGLNMPSDPFEYGKRFDGWKNFNSSTKVYTDLKVESSWKQCKNHVWGRCGVTHTGTKAAYLSGHSKSHKSQKYQCKLCVECGTFAIGTCLEITAGNCINKYLDRSKIGAVHLCYQSSGCRNLWNKEFPYVFNVHEKIGYP